MPSKKIQLIPYWCQPVLQGLAYWSGYCEAYSKNYVFTEGAIVEEVFKLIQAHLKGDEELLTEVAYRWILGRASDFNQERVDLLIAARETSKKKPEKLSGRVCSIIEVKRPGSRKAILEDIDHLGRALQKAEKGVRGFVLFTSQGRRPKLFVDECGKTLIRPKGIPGQNTPFKVRRVCKAAHSFKGYNTAHYTCLVEVFAKAV